MQLQQLRITLEDPKPAHCWVCVDSVQGTFTAADCQHDMATIKFERAFALRVKHRTLFPFYKLLSRIPTCIKNVCSCHSIFKQRQQLII